MAMSDRPISDVLQDIVRNIQLIVRSEVLLAKAELREEVTRAKSAGILTAGGAVCGIFGAFFLLMAAVYGLTRLVPDWAAALIVAGCLCVAAAILIKSGIAQLKLIHPAPEKTIESVKESVEWAKQQIK